MSQDNSQTGQTKASNGDAAAGDATNSGEAFVFVLDGPAIDIPAEVAELIRTILRMSARDWKRTVAAIRQTFAERRDVAEADIIRHTTFSRPDDARRVREFLTGYVGAHTIAQSVITLGNAGVYRDRKNVADLLRELADKIDPAMTREQRAAQEYAAAQYADAAKQPIADPGEPVPAAKEPTAFAGLPAGSVVT